MPRPKVLLTDYAWADLGVERRVLRQIDAELVVAEAQDVQSLARLAEDVEAILTCWAKLPAEVIEAAPRCRIISRLGVGLDNIDVSAATRRGIVVTNVPDYCVPEVAEHTLALLLALARKVAFYHHQTKCGAYHLTAGPPLRRLAGQTLGIVGLGRIGREVARRATALDLRVLATSRSRVEVDGVAFCELDELLAASDFVSLHVPLNDQTQRLIGAAQLARMKPSAYLINTARGGLIDHESLAAALSADEIAGAALDVQQPEPPDLTRPPFSDPRVIVTPHAAFASEESLAELRTRATQHVVERLGGRRPPHVVNPGVLEA